MLEQPHGGEAAETGTRAAAPAAQHQWCLELKQQYLCPDWWQKGL